MKERQTLFFLFIFSMRSCSLLFSAMSYNFTTVPLMDQQSNGQLELTLSQLRKATKFLIVVRAFNRYGEGPLSAPSSAVTFEDGQSIFLLFFFFFIRLMLNSFFSINKWISSICGSAIVAMFHIVVAEH